MSNEVGGVYGVGAPCRGRGDGGIVHFVDRCGNRRGGGGGIIVFARVCRRQRDAASHPKGTRKQESHGKMVLLEDPGCVERHRCRIENTES